MSGTGTGGTRRPDGNPGGCRPNDIRPDITRPDIIRSGGVQPGIIKPFTIGRTLWHGFGAFFHGIVPVMVTVLVLLTPVVVISWLASAWGIEALGTGRGPLAQGGADNGSLLPRDLTRRSAYFVLQLFIGYFHLLAAAAVSAIVVQRLQGKSRAVLHMVATLPAIARSVLGLTAGLAVALGGLKILLALPGPVYMADAVARIIMLLVLAAAIMLMVLFFVVIPVIAVDAPGFRTGLYRGYGRSLFLTRGNRWRILSLLIVLFFMFVMVVLAMSSMLAVVMMSIDLRQFSGILIFAMPLEIFATLMVSSSVVTGLMASFAAVAYWLLCIEKDGPATETLEAVFA